MSILPQHNPFGSWKDYSFTQKYMPIMGMVGFSASFFFFFTNQWTGNRESLWVRIFGAIACLPLFFFPKEKTLNKIQILLWELAVTATLPFTGIYMFLLNDSNKYWFAVMIFGGLTQGLCSKPQILPMTFVSGGLAGVLAFNVTGNLNSGLLIIALQGIFLSALMAVIGTGIKTALEYSHYRTVKTKIAEARAEELQKTNLELQRREEIIRLYVRPSLVEEIRAGKDPSKSEPVIRNLSIMFCDIRDFTKLTETLTPYERQMFLNQYFSMMTRPIVQNGGEVDKIMGDCVMSVFPDGEKAVNAAVAMRIELHKFNETMFAAQSPMIRNGIGIAKGEVMQGNFGSFEKLDRTVIGEAVNIASRLESKTKMYNLEVVVTEDVIKDLPSDAKYYRWIDVVQVKGSTRNIRLYEIYGHQPPEVRQYKDETRELLEKALTIYFQKGFRDASRLFRAMLEKVPPHTRKTR